MARKRVTKMKDPFIYREGKQCHYCAKEPVRIALVQTIPEKPTQVYLCEYHRFHMPEGTTILTEAKFGRTE